MEKSRYSDEQVVRILHEADRDAVPDVAKRNGVSEVSIYAWRKRFGEMVSDDVKREFPAYRRYFIFGVMAPLR